MVLHNHNAAKLTALPLVTGTLLSCLNKSEATLVAEADLFGGEWQRYADV
jgi:hypothetical protein